MRNLHVVSPAEAVIISYGLTLDMRPESLRLERVNRWRSGVTSAIAYSEEARRGAKMAHRVYSELAKVDSQRCC
jgi:hypothetical protein